MKNPFRADDAVMTMVKGKKVEALVTQTWQNEVQVKTVDGDLLWRSMYTVWYPGRDPLAREQNASKSVATSARHNAASKSARAPVNRGRNRRKVARRQPKKDR